MSAGLSAYVQLAGRSHEFVLDLLGQANNLAVLAEHEQAALAAKAPGHVSTASPFTLAALRTSTALVQFTALEALLSLMAELAMAVVDGTSGGPTCVGTLHMVERDFLSEEETYFDAKKGVVSSRAGKFTNTMDRFVAVPTLLGRVLGVTVTIDKSGKGWQSLQALKELRDRLTHPKVATTSDGKPAPVSAAEVYAGASALHWYLKTLEPVLQQANADPDGWLKILWLTLHHVRASANVSEREFQQRFPTPTGIGV